MWRWSNFLQQYSFDTRKVVLINFDETNVKLVGQERPGHITERAHRLSVSSHSVGRKAGLRAQRSTLTHLAAVCNCHEVQASLPQLVLIGEKQTDTHRFRAIQAAAPPGVHIWREKSAWTNADIMCRYILLLKRSLEHLRETHRFILFFDVAKSHLADKTLRCAARAAFWVCIIPAQMTWVLQPCDTHVFSQYKAKLMQFVQEGVLASATGVLDWEMVLRALWRVLGDVVGAKHWHDAFASVGLAENQVGLSIRTKNKLQLADISSLDCRTPPTMHDLELIFPRRMHVPVHVLFLAVERCARGLAPEPTARPAEASSPTVMPPLPHPKGPWYGRTRSTSARALLERPSASSSRPPWQPLRTDAMTPPPPPRRSLSPTRSAASQSQPPRSGLQRVPMGKRLPRPLRWSLESPPPPPPPPGV